MPEGKTNFLFILTDQQRADHLSCMGNNVLKTPNIDAIAARGVRFTRSYVASPICMPNRCSLLTGRMPSAHTVRTNGIPLPLHTTTIADMLRAQGYSTGIVGKMHVQNVSGWPPEQERPRVAVGHADCPPNLSEARKPIRCDGPYDQELLARWADRNPHDVTLPYYGFDHVRLVLGHGDQAHGHYGRWLEDRLPNASALTGPDNALPSDITAPYAWRTGIPEELYPTAYVAEKSIEFLQDHTAREGNAPFFLVCSFPDPHHPFTPPGRYWDMYRPADIPVPKSFGGNERPPLPTLDHVRRERDVGTRRLDSMFCIGVSELEAREATALTYGQISMIDDAVGRIVEKLEALDLIQSTVLVYASDHGEYMGDHQLLTKGPLHYQGLIRVPTIWADPRGECAGAICGALCSSIDIAASILDRAGIQPFNGLQGRSFLAAISENDSPIHDSLLIEDENQQKLLGFSGHCRVRTIVTEVWRMSIYDRAEWGELYDLSNDPDEMNNMWNDSKYSDVKAELLEKMVRKMIDHSDRSPFPTFRA